MGQSHILTDLKISFTAQGLMSKHISTPFVTSLGLNGRAWIQPPGSPKLRTPQEILAEEVHEIRFIPIVGWNSLFCWSNPPSFHGQIPIWVGEIPILLLESLFLLVKSLFFLVISPLLVKPPDFLLESSHD